MPQALASVAAPLAIASILMVPLGFRDLPSVNHGEHESFNFAWINSALHGKLLWADAGLVHGPLRDYLMIAFLSPARITLEHIRMAFVIVNLIGLALLLPVAWEAARKDLRLHALGAYLLLMQTPARSILWYKHMTSLGWADLIRTALPTVALFGAMRAPDDPRAVRSLAGCGFVMGLSLLYSQEFALCAAAGVVVALFVDRWFSERPPRERLRRALVAESSFLSSLAVPPLILFVIYAAKGRGSRLVATAYESLAFAAAGVWGSIRFPISAESMVDPRFLFKEFSDGSKHYDSPVIYLLPIAVYVVAGLAIVARAASRRWSRRASLELALLVFGVTSYRVTMATPDIWHLLSTTTPAILLLIGLAADARRFRWHVPIGRMPLPIGVAAVMGLAVAVLGFGEYSTGVVRKLAELNDGDEKPPGVKAYVNEDIPRAGDVHIPTQVQQIVSYIDREVKPSDPIFICAGIFDGAELYFLSDRRNPSRFDTLSEIVTQSRREELLDALRRDPPELVIGSDMTFFDSAITNYLAAEWDAPKIEGGYTVRRRKR
jgi:hypothetical protein